MQQRSLNGKVAWVTGSSRGIGRAIADHLASLGADLAVHGTHPTSTKAFNEAPSLQAVADEISRKHQVAVHPVFGDLCDEQVVVDIGASIQQRFDRVDILVNCAGGDIGAAGVQSEKAGKPAGNDAVNISVSDLRTVLDRNLLTCILPCRAIAPSNDRTARGLDREHRQRLRPGGAAH